MGDLTCDVAVVGGGLVGASLAYELVSRGADVLLLDGRHPGRATDAGAGILSPETTWHPDDGLFAFGCAAAVHYRALVDRLTAAGAEDTGYAPCGLLMVGIDPGEDDWFATRAELARRRSPGLLRPLTAAQARDLFPPLGETRHALHNPAAARVDGRSMRAALLHAARAHGLRDLEANVSALRIEGGRVLGVVSDLGPVSGAAVAVAGGAWSSSFADQLGVRIPVAPVKGQIVHLALPPDRHHPVDTGGWPIVSPVLNHYLVAWPGGRVACGGTYEPAASFDTRPTVAGLAELLHAALVIAPGLADAVVADVRVGLRPVSEDHLPVLGPVPGWDNVHLLTGHGTEGLLLGPYSSALVARALTEASVPEDLAPFALDRFPP